jgi:hypothetical protein
MQRHLEKHSIFPPSDTASLKKPQPSIISLITKQETLTHQQLFEKNLLRWIVQDKQAFTVIVSQAFQQIFEDIPGINLPFTSRSTIRRRLVENFDKQRLQLKEELARSCKTIALSLDVDKQKPPPYSWYYQPLAYRGL